MLETEQTICRYKRDLETGVTSWKTPAVLGPLFRPSQGRNIIVSLFQFQFLPLRDCEILTAAADGRKSGGVDGF